jgi:hypothetical protein
VDPHWFKWGPDPAFTLNAEREPKNADHTDPDPGQTLPSRKGEFLQEKQILIIEFRFICKF